MKIMFTLLGLLIGAGMGGTLGAIVLGALGFGLGYVLQKGSPPEPSVDLFDSSSPPPAASAPKREAQPDLQTQVKLLSERIERLEAHLGIAPAAEPKREPEPMLQLEPLAAPQPEPPPAPTVEPVAAAPMPEVTPEPAPAPMPQIEPEPTAVEPPALQPEDQRAPEPVVEPLAVDYTPPPPPPAAPSAPSFLQRLISENIVAKVGVIVLFFGVGFLLKFAYDRGMLPPELRLAGVLAGAGLLLFIGWRLRHSHRLYAMILQGGASGLAYLDVFFALKTYGFIGPVAGFSLFAILGVATTMSAVRYDAPVLAVLGLAGAFMAPVLASTGSGNYVLLFSYYTLLNVFILGVSWFKAWRPLNLTGWFFTFAVALAWGSANYRPELFSTVEPFVLLFFALYLIIPILFATRQPPELKGIVDGTLVFGTPAAVAVMQAGLVHDIPNGLAWSAAGAGALYALLAAVIWRQAPMRLLRETYLALAVGLGTLAIFFGFDAYPTFALWTLEGTAILWVALRQERALARWFALLVQVAGALMFLSEYDGLDRSQPVLNDAIYGCLWIVVASGISAVLTRRYRERLPEGQRVLSTLFLLWGAAWWSLGGMDALDHAVASEILPASAGMFFAATFFACELAGTRAGWRELRALCAAHAPILALAALFQLNVGGHALGNLGYLAWPLGLGSAFWALLRQERDGVALLAAPRYLLQWGTVAVLATWEEIWLLKEEKYAFGMLLAAVAHAAAWLRFRLRERDAAAPVPASGVVLLWAMGFWFLHGGLWAEAHFDHAAFIAAMLGLVAASAAVYETAGAVLGWRALRHATVVLWVAMPLAIAAQILDGLRFWAAGGWAAWLAAYGVAFLSLTRQERDGIAIAAELRRTVHWATLAVLATWEEVSLLRAREYAYGMLLAAAAHAAAWLRFRLRERDAAAPVPVSTVVLLWAIGFWLVNGGVWAEEQLSHAALIAAMLGLVAGTAAVYEISGSALGWRALRQATLLLWVAMPAALAAQAEAGLRPWASAGWAVWPAAYLVGYWSLYRQERDGVAIAAPLGHALGLWMAVWIVGRELSLRFLDWEFGSAWTRSAWGMSFAAAVGAAVAWGNAGRWPVAPRRELYRGVVLAPVVALAGAWFLYINLRSPGAMAPVPYLPILNPIDVACAATLAACLPWSAWLDGDLARAGVLVRRVAWALGFAWLNGIALRSIHFWADVPYRLDRLLESVLVQATLSLLWTSTALALMLIARRRLQRTLWGIGAGLLAVVVFKLFVVDLANTGTVARIVSFIGVGALLLVIGYAAPVPPAAPAPEDARKEPS